MKNETVLTVLMYLFHNHMEKDNRLNLNDMQLVDELKSAGFHAHVIGKAFRWLHRLTEFASQDTSPSTNSFRVFSEEECQLINIDCRSFIIGLEMQGILSPLTREIVIHQTLELINEGIDLSLLKWVTLMVLFNMPNSEHALSHMEFLVLAHAMHNLLIKVWDFNKSPLRFATILQKTQSSNFVINPPPPHPTLCSLTPAILYFVLVTEKEVW